MIQDTPQERHRTARQNKALHTYLEMVAHELLNQGQTMTNVINKLPQVEITPTKDSVKEIIWRPLQEAVVGKKSTTELTTTEVTKVYEIMSMFLSKQFGISLSFPEDLGFEQYLEANGNKID